MANLNQPIFSRKPEAGHNASSVILLNDYIKLLRDEEDYWNPDQNNTRLMITRLRKIFYDQWGWNSELIRGAAHIESRYITSIKETKVEHGKDAPRYKNLIYTPVYRVVTYTDKDRVFGKEKVGQVPFVYQQDHQDVLLPEGVYCDVAHILAGLDAINNKQLVSPLPNFLFFLAKLFPNVDSNVDIVTWLGDLASSSADFLFDYLKNGDKKLTLPEDQVVIDADDSGSDMLGDIEPYVIAHHYAIGATNGMRFTEILEDYYFGDNSYRKSRFLSFCNAIGLEDWNGTSFVNEEKWLKYYYKEMRNGICFVAFSQNEKSLSGILLPLKIWFNGYSDVLQIENVLKLFLTALKSQIQTSNN
jgi:hypothetical protein